MKGSILDMSGVIIYAFIFAVILFAIYFMVTAFHTTASGIPMFSGNADAMATLVSAQDALIGMDNLLAFVVFMFCLVAIISAYLAPTHPILFIVFFLLTLILIPVSAMFANMFTELYSTGPLVGVETNFPITLLIFEWLPKITIIMSMGIALVMYIRGGGSTSAY